MSAASRLSSTTSTRSGAAARRRVACRPPSLRPAARRRHRFRERQADPEGAAVADAGALDRELAAVLLDQRPGQGEADAQARIVHAGRRALLGEEIEDPFLRFGRDAAPVVGDRGDDDPVDDDDLQVDAAAAPACTWRRWSGG